MAPEPATALPTLAAARAAAHRTTRRMVADGLVIGSAGNVSVRVRGRVPRCVVSPAGVAYEKLAAAQYPVVDLSDGSWRGELAPTSELALHRELLRRMPEVAAIVHTHSRAATAFAVARRPLPFVCNENLGTGGAVPVTEPYAIPSSTELAVVAADTFARSGTRAVLLANHGVVAIGATPDAAYLVAAQVEWIATICLGAEALGGAHSLGSREQAAMAAAYGVELGAR